MKSVDRIITLYVLVAACVLGVVGSQVNKQATLPGIADQVARTLPTVVHISKVGEWQGSGCVVSPDGMIFTAKHVVEGGGTFEVTLNDGRKFTTTKALADKTHDIGFLKIDVNTPLPYASLTTLDTVRVGDPVYVAGSPMGKVNFNSVTLGIISCKQRNLNDLSPEESAVYGWSVTFQSDSAAYPGNSGGPVFNINGDVIGVLVAGIGPGLNYSVPIEACRYKWQAVREWFALMDLQVVEPPKFEITEGDWNNQSEAVEQLTKRVEALENYLDNIAGIY